MINILNLSVTAGQIWSKVWPVLVAILFFGLIILIHELGHFMWGKIFKVKINEFSIGMGPAIFKKKKNETQYSIRCLPIGGYVSMEGEDGGSDDKNAFGSKKPWQKFIILAAGAVNNLILGLIFVAILTCMGDLIGTRQIHSFYDNATSCRYGLKEGDIIKNINGEHIFSSRDIDYALIRDEDATYDFIVERDGKDVELKNVKFQQTKAANGENTIIFDFILVGVKKTPLNVIKTTFMDTISLARLVWLSLFDLITGRYGLNELSGPIGTVTVVAEAASSAASGGIPMDTIFYIMALITINIGVFNLLPIPALDGGRLFFVLIEWIRGKPVSPKREGLVHAIGFALLMGFMVIVTFSDIRNLFNGTYNFGW